MRNKFLLLLFFTCLVSVASAQNGKPIKLVDTLTKEEKNSRNPILLKTELDSLVKQYNAAHPPVIPAPVVKETVTETVPLWMWFAVIIPLIGIGGLLYLLFNNQRLSGKKIDEMKKIVQQNKISGVTIKETSTETKPSRQTGKKIQDAQAELDKMKKENADLKELLEEYETVKQQIVTSYKIRNYPGYEASKSEEELLLGMLKTEKSVATYSYEHFLKPIIAIADSNKNNPARTSKEDREKLMELLVSLALLYIEYLYLRVNELAVGGNMVARIKGMSNGNRLDTLLMKQLNKEHGSRALVLRMILDKMDIRDLSYPVFDETNLNLS
ncbi:MAG TPA: hypothetical protein VHM26_04880 [Chitinophagaceae bacterium]|nr:hypothetical protein [Chitinophagaceae bacterium]